jgi:hypothetical protein
LEKKIAGTIPAFALGTRKTPKNLENQEKPGEPRKTN